MLRSEEVARLEKELQRIRHNYFTARKYDNKKTLRKRDRELCDQLAVALTQSGECSGTDAKRLATWNPYNTNKAADFFDPGWMFGVTEGFDISIGNPPYVRQEEIKELKPLFKGQFDCFTGIADLYVFFYERSFQILKSGGVVSFISSNKYFRAGYGERLRWFLTYCGKIRLLLDFGDAPVFAAIAYPSIIVVQKTRGLERGELPDPKRIHESHLPVGDNAVAVQTWPPEADISDFPKVFQKKSFCLAQKDLKPDGWRLESPKVLRLLDKLRAAGKPLGDYCSGRLYYGLKTGLNEAFVVSRATRDELIKEHASSSEVLRPFLRGRDIKRWGCESQDLWLLFVPWHFPLHNDATISGPSAEAERELKKRFPAIYAHLLKFKRELSARNTAETGVRYEWYALQRWGADYWHEFANSKVFVPAIEDEVNYAPDTTGFLGNDKTSFFIPPSVPISLAVTNSQVSWWITRQTFASKQSGFYEFKPMYISQIPIPEVPPADQTAVESLVTRIVKAKATNLSADVSGLEKEIDERVYRLYGLTPEEIKIIEEPSR